MIVQCPGVVSVMFGRCSCDCAVSGGGFGDVREMQL